MAALQVTLAVNKCENAAKADLQAADFWGLGLEPIAVSAFETFNQWSMVTESRLSDTRTDIWDHRREYSAFELPI